MCFCAGSTPADVHIFVDVRFRPCRNEQLERKRNEVQRIYNLLLLFAKQENFYLLSDECVCSRISPHLISPTCNWEMP